MVSCRIAYSGSFECVPSIRIAMELKLSNSALVIQIEIMNSGSSTTKKNPSKHSKNVTSYENVIGGLDTINEMSD